MIMSWSRVLVRAVMLMIVPLAVLGVPGSGSAQGDTADLDGPVYLVDVSGTIDLGLAPYLDRVIGEAENEGAAAIIIEIDTPGGRLDAVIQMRDTIIDTDVRTIALVDATAFSAGALVAIASDEIYMTPGSVMGAATPVLGGTGEVADEKTISAVRATFESAAEQNGRDPRVAAAMVDTRIEIEGLVTDEELLTLTVSEALEFGYAEGVVANLDELLEELGLLDNELVATSLSFAEQLVRFLTNPLLAGLLLLGGFLLIIGDLFSGGVGIAALGGVVLLSIFFWGHLLAGLAGWEDIALVVLGIALIAVEVFVLPGFGVAGILGLISLGTGAFLAMIFRDFDFVTNDDLWRAGLTVGLTLMAAAVGIVLLVMLVSRRGPPSGLVLSTRLGSGEAVTERTNSGWLGWFDSNIRLEPDRIDRPIGTETNPDDSLVGATGLAVSDLRPGGIVEIDGHRLDVVTSGEFLPAGVAVEVVRDDRYRRVVRKQRS
jgi:membrane-bound serine protease (ClpP class)